jgi:hypothetical protein
MAGPSSSEDEDRSITGAFPEGPPYSNTSEQGQREHTFDGDPGGGGDPDGPSGGVLVLLGDRLPFLEGEWARLLHLWSSIVGKKRARKVNPKRKRKKSTRW